MAVCGLAQVTPLTPQKPSLTLLACGAACCVFAAIWLFWLLLANTGDLLDLLAAAADNARSRDHLARHGLTRPGPIRFTVTQFIIQTALLGVLIWTGCALLLKWPSARWCGLTFSGFAIACALLSTIVRVFFLTLPGELVMVGPVALDAIVILFAIVLGAVMFLPSVAATHAGKLEEARDGTPAA
jgi:hypothetical protein